MVGATGFEPVTPAVSRQCSTAELRTLKRGTNITKNKNLKNNFEATKIYHESGGIKGMNIVGMAALVKKGLLKLDITTP